MPNTETVRALVSAFNVNNHFSNTVETNFTLQSDGKKDYIVVSFDKGMGRYQCSRYLDSIKRKIVGEFYGIEEGDTDEVVLNTANLIFNIESFPFNTSKGKWSQDEQGRIEFLAPIDKGVIFNLKSHLASSLKKDILEGMPACRIVTKASNRKDYLWHGNFDNKESRKQFEREFLSRMRERYENVPKKPLEVKGNSVYIKDVFDDARFIDSVTRYKAWLEGMYLGVDSSTNHRVKLFKDMIVESIGESTGVIIYGFMCASPSNRKEASILIPIMQNCRGARLLTKEEAGNINRAFNYAVLNDLYGRTQAELSTNGSSEMYSIDFSNPEISHCVITKIIESSVINKDHELAIDPELRFQALSPAQSPFNSPTHAGPSGLRTPPNQRGRDSGYDSNSPPRPEDSVAHSSSGGPRSSVEQVQTQRLPTQSQDGALKDSPRRESEKFPVLLPVNQLDVPGTSREFLPSPQLSSSGPSSWKGANESGSAWTSQPIGYWSSQSSNVKEDCKKIHEVFEEAYEKIVSGSSLSKEEQELFKKLLYWFNLNNYALDPPHTNFIVKNGKIASLIDDSVDVKEYLQKVIDKTKEEYRVNKKEAYDLNEFPFEFLSNCEKNQKTTVVANISRDALFNLKKLFIQESEKEVKIEDIDINIVKKAVKSKKDEWADSQVQEFRVRPDAALKTCYPDESELENIPITKDEGGYWLDRTYGAWEVKSFLEERRYPKGTSVAKKGKPEGQDSGIGSSGDTTDAENVSSKAEATTSGYESMDCENTGGRSPKRKSPSPEDGGNPRKSPKRDSLPLSRLESLSLSSSSYQIGKC